MSLMRCSKNIANVLRLIKILKYSRPLTELVKIAPRFSTYKKLIAYCGLDPSVDESGKHKGESRISKRGNAHLRRIIWLMSVNVVRHNEYFKAYFQRKRSQGLVYKKSDDERSTQVTKNDICYDEKAREIQY